ncbi:hypothetical protein ACS0TY_003002 [Phlomoides rotata]
MSCLFWNCRGLGNPRRVPALKKEILQKDPSFVFLCETKLCVRELEGVSRKLGFECCFGVDCDRSGNGRRGGLRLLWKSDVSVSIQSFSLHHVDALVAGISNGDLLGSMAILKMGGVLRVEERMIAFKECLERNRLTDVGYTGHAYTWSNKQSGLNNIKERLDRGVASDGWLEAFRVSGFLTYPSFCQIIAQL